MDGYASYPPPNVKGVNIKGIQRRAPGLRAVLLPEWKTKGKYVDPPQYSEDAKKSIEYMLKEANSTGDSEWEYLTTKKDVVIKKRENTNPSILCVRGKGVISAAPSDVVRLLRALPRTEWDTLCTESRILEQIDEHTYIYHDFFRARKCFIRIPRDLVFFSRSYELEGGGFIVAAHGVKHPNGLEEEGMERMRLYPSGWIILPHKSEGDSPTSLVTYILQLDLKIPYMPEAFLSLVSVNQPLMIDRLRDIIALEQKERERLLLLKQRKEKSREKKFEDFVQSFPSSEECVTYFLQKFQQSNPDSLSKALEVLPISMRVSKEIPSEKEILEQLETRGRERGSSLHSQVVCVVTSLCGDRPTMEDSHFIARHPMGELTCTCVAVFDGHYGNASSSFCQATFPFEFFGILEKKGGKVSEALKASFASIEQKFLEEAVKQQTEAGTTATVSVVMGNTLYVANVGDSEAVLCRDAKAIVLTDLHSPHNPREVERVKSVGGAFHSNHKLIHPIWNPSVISLGVTRALGDVYFKAPRYTDGKPTGLSAEPTLRYFSVPDLLIPREVVIRSGDEFVIVATDGLWQVITYQEAVDFVIVHLKELSPQEVCDKLVEYAYSKRSRDNITVIIILLS